MRAFVSKLRRLNETLSENEEFYRERKQLNGLHTYYSHSLLYLERLDRAIKDINLMISDLNTCLMSFFESDVHMDIIKQVSFTLKSFNNVRDKVCNQIIQSKHVVNSQIERIKNVKNLCIKKKKLNDDIEHYEKKIQKLQTVAQPSQKHLDKIIRNENKLNKVKAEYYTCFDNIKKGISNILDNKINKVLSDAKRNLELMLYYFSLMNSASIKLKEPLKVFEMPYPERNDACSLPIEDNFFLEQEDKMNYFNEKKNKTNPFFYDVNEKNACSQNLNSKNTNMIFNFKSFLRDSGKPSKSTSAMPYFPQ